MLGVSGSGLKSWLAQRISGVILGLYILFFCGIVLSNGTFEYQDWKALFGLSWMKYATFFALLSLVAHAQNGMWTISTDYLKSTWLRFLFQLLTSLSLLCYLAFGIQILWGK